MKVFGDKARFALGFELISDPDRGLPEDRASWACLEIWVVGRHLTSGLSDSGVQVQGAEVPLAPVLRWLLGQWDSLFHEERLPRENLCTSAAAWRTASLLTLPKDDGALDALLSDREAWWKRHALGAALPGFRVPDLHVRRQGHQVELSWTDQEWRTVPGGMQVLEAPGSANLSAEEASRVFFEFATAVVGALAEVGTVPEFVAAMRGLIEKIERPDRATIMRRLRIAAGQSLEGAAVRLRRSAGVVGGKIEETIAVLLGMGQDWKSGLVTPLSVPVLMYRSASPSLSGHDLQSLLELAMNRPSGDGLLGQLQTPKEPPRDPLVVTEQGYELGIWLRKQLGIPEAAPLVGDNDIEGALPGRLGIELAEVQLEDEGVDGVAAKVPGSMAVIAVNRSGRFSRTAVGRRMTIAHELCHLLFDVDAQGQVGVVSNPWAPYAAERRANSFAAMLLLPEAALAARLPSDARKWSTPMMQKVMDEMGVGRTTLTWQLRNLGWISESERRAWLDTL